MDLIICNSGIIRRIKFNLPTLEEYTINTTLFLEGCKNLATFLGYFGMALRSIQYIILANAELISKWYKDNDDYLNEDLTMALAKEFQKEEIRMNQATYYLMKCLVFCTEVLNCLVEECQEENLMRCIEKAYDRTLGPYQNQLPNWLFHILLKTCRSKNEVLDRMMFEDNASEEDMKKEISSLVEVIAHSVSILKEHFETRWHDIDHYFL